MEAERQICESEKTVATDVLNPVLPFAAGLPVWLLNDPAGAPWQRGTGDTVGVKSNSSINCYPR